MSWNVEYTYKNENVSYTGYSSSSQEEYEQFLEKELSVKIQYYLGNTDFQAFFSKTIEGLKTTDFESVNVEQSLKDVIPASDWGEYFSYHQLETHLGVSLPWPPSWDKRAKKASQQGPDIVGLKNNGGIQIFVFGEVKTSSESRCPPNIMVNGGDGMIDQIKRLELFEIRMFLIKWLVLKMNKRGREDEIKDAIRNHLKDNYSIIGILVRDTPPNEADLKCVLTKIKNNHIPKSFHGYYIPVVVKDSISLCTQGRRSDAGA